MRMLHCYVIDLLFSELFAFVYCFSRWFIQRQVGQGVVCCSVLFGSFFSFHPLSVYVFLSLPIRR
jgi:hypothetical protein